MKNKRKKRAVTLIEIMIVIVLIGLIGGALAFNMRGSLDKGQKFKSEQNLSKVYDILMMEYAVSSKSLDEIISQKEQILNDSPLTKEGEKLLRDAWRGDVTVGKEGDDLVIKDSKGNQAGGVQ
ncbi:MAG: hypothetical protein K940chlam9_00704 [Chlamydiae bacterium]|nr:hypothetical protein [Chlamydiota bacterium]